MEIVTKTLMTISQLVSTLIDRLGPFLLGYKAGGDRQRQAEAEAEAEILRKQRDIANEAPVDNPLQAMRDHAKGDGDEKTE